MSSVKSRFDKRSSLTQVTPSLPLVANRMTQSMATAKRRGKTAFSDTSNQMEPSFVFTQHHVCSYIFSIADTIFREIPYVIKIFHMEGLWMLSKALVKSIKLIARGNWYS